jgi:hypothetical protein
MQPDIRAADLLHGSDHDFVVNLYLAVLDRWPDPGGYDHTRAMIAEGLAGRQRAIITVIGSEEAAQRGRRLTVDDPLLPGPPERALAAQLSLRTEFLMARMGQPPSAADIPGMPEALVRELRAELAALRAEMRDRLAELAARAAAPPLPPAPLDEDRVHDLLALAEARLELRLRALEKRLP